MKTNTCVSILPHTAGALLLGTLAIGCSVRADRGSATDSKVGTISQALFETGAAFAWVQANGTIIPNYSYTDSESAFSNAWNPNPGWYFVTVPNAFVSGDPGNVQVVAYGSDNDRCNVVNWSPSGSDMSVEVHCFTPSGTSTNSAFVMHYIRSPGFDAYLMADQPSASSYYPASGYSYNIAATNTLKGNSITRQGPGAYSVYLPYTGSSGGTVLITAVGTTTNYCKAFNWYPSGTYDEYVNVRCFNSAGAPADTVFSLYYSWGVTWDGNRGAWTWANDPTSAYYTPASSWTYDSGTSCATGDPNSSQSCGGSRGTTPAYRYGTGTYFLHHSLMDPVNSAVHITSYGADSNYCKIRDWVSDGDGVGVWSLCFNASGAPADAQYVEVYATGDSP
ncbi:MAG TPA: hypothetical protein VKU41_19875 [Polyangiaceae bacterium]|nr:hypothetical protein [Polyangiaceae bacterium]